jgi:ATP-dependent DNA ligase I
VLLAELAATSQAVTATSSRRAKIDAIAGLLRRTEAAEVPIAVAFLSGELRQRQIGVGYAALRDIGGFGEAIAAAAGDLDPATVPAGSGPGHAASGTGQADTRALTLTDVDVAFAQIGAAVGAGSQAERRRLLASLFGSAAGQERSFLIRLLSGDLHQGALEGVMVEAIAKAADVPPEEVRRAHMLGGSLLAVASAALAPSEHATALAALRSFRLQVGRPLQPMLASSADSIGAALERVRPAAVEWKIDGIRVQVHKDGSDVMVFTRTLDDITSRVPEVVAAAAGLPATCAVLDGEIIALGPDGRPRPFQVTASRTGNRSDVARLAAQVPLTAFFFDMLHLDGADLVDSPGAQRYARLAEAVPEDLVIPRIVTAQDAEAAAFFDGAVARGHEGVLIKSLDSPYAAGRRGLGWIKVKPRHTLDLVVIAAEWGHGRRRGWLSNLHLAARDPGTGGYVMLGKTFKGLTDEILTWQTSRLLDLADPPRSRLGEGGKAAREEGAYGVVRVRPELVVEVAFDGVQASPRYPGGLALRFARVLRYRPDKRPADADTIGTIREIAAKAGVTP